MKAINLFILCIISGVLFGNSNFQDQLKTDSLFIHFNKEILVLKNMDDSLTNKFHDLLKEYTALTDSYKTEKLNSLQRQKQIDSLRLFVEANIQMVESLRDKIEERSSVLNERINSTAEITDEKISSLDESISKTTLYWIIAILILFLLGMLGYWFLRKKLFLSQSNLLTNIATVRNELESESLRLDEKLIKILENQLEVQSQSLKSTKDSEVDHSLALKVADEIIRIEKNISRMDEGTKGLKQLSQAVNRIKDNFASNGYEIVDMIGKEYDEGMKVSANFRIDPALTSDERIISRIIKPQVNYKGIMIQSAQVEVSQGE